MTLFVDLREVETADARQQRRSARRASVAGVSVEDGQWRRWRAGCARAHQLTQPAAHQVRSKRNVIYVDLDSAFPLGSAARAVAAAWRAACRRPPGSPRRWKACAPTAKPTGASITLTGNGELLAESVTPFGDGTPRVVLDFPNVRSQDAGRRLRRSRAGLGGACDDRRASCR